MGGRTSRMLFSGRENSNKVIGQDAVNVLAGHGGRILCLQTAWHCDKLLSGAADSTMKLWDLAGMQWESTYSDDDWTLWVRYNFLIFVLAINPKDSS